MPGLLPLQPESDHGWKIPGIDFRLDPPRHCQTAFVSHAHSDHVARHARAICSRPTADLLAARYGIAPAQLEPHPFFQPWEESGHRFELLPAGHILGSAMLHVTRLSDSASLLYTGDFKLRESLTAERAVAKPAGLLLMETTFGQARYVFPPRARLWEEVRRFAVAAHEADAIPVFAGYSLGKAQEIIANLAPLQRPILAHPSILKLEAPYRRHCPLDWPELRPLGSDAPSAGHLVVTPPNTLRSPAILKCERRRVMMLTGWSLAKGAAYRYRVDAVLPVSDHADFPELLELVESVRPSRVITVHGFEEEFAATLRGRGIEAWSGRGRDQLELFPDATPFPWANPPG